MNEYEEMRNRHQKRFDTWAEVHIFFAFDDKQFREGMQSLRLDPETVRNVPRLLHGLQKAERAIIGQE